MATPVLPPDGGRPMSRPQVAVRMRASAGAGFKFAGAPTSATPFPVNHRWLIGLAANWRRPGGSAGRVRRRRRPAGIEAGSPHPSLASG